MHLPSQWLSAGRFSSAHSRETLLLKEHGWADANPGLTETKDQDVIRLTRGLTAANLIPVNYTEISLHSRMARRMHLSLPR